MKKLLYGMLALSAGLTSFHAEGFFGKRERERQEEAQMAFFWNIRQAEIETVKEKLRGGLNPNFIYMYRKKEIRPMDEAIEAIGNALEDSQELENLKKIVFYLVKYGAKVLPKYMEVVELIVPEISEKLKIGKPKIQEFDSWRSNYGVTEIELRRALAKVRPLPPPPKPPKIMPPPLPARRLLMPPRRQPTTAPPTATKPPWKLPPILPRQKVWPPTHPKPLRPEKLTVVPL